jgi:hypothetical protein
VKSQDEEQNLDEIETVEAEMTVRIFGLRKEF